MERALNKNIQTIYCMTFFQSAMVVSAVFVPLLQRHGLTMAEVLQTQAIFALVVAAFEVPSGYLADVWGRKRVILAGQGLISAAFFWFMFADSYTDFVVYEVVIGVGISLCSGADLALLFDSRSALRGLNKESDVAPSNHISRLVAIESYSGALAAILAGLLILWALEWVLLVQVCASVIAFGFALQLTEVDRQINLDSTGESLVDAIAVVARKPLVLWTSIAIVIFSFASLLGFWLIQKYWESQQIPLYLFGYIWAAHGVVRGISANLAHIVEEKLGWRNVFLLVAFLPILGFVGMGLLDGWIGIACGLLLPVSRGLNMVIFYDALNRRVSAVFRATINSLVSLGTRTLFIFGGPLLGFLVDARGVNFSLLTLAAVFVPVYMVVLVVLGRNIVREPVGEAKTAIAS